MTNRKTLTKNLLRRELSYQFMNSKGMLIDNIRKEFVFLEDGMGGAPQLALRNGGTGEIATVSISEFQNEVIYLSEIASQIYDDGDLLMNSHDARAVYDLFLTMSLHSRKNVIPYPQPVTFSDDPVRPCFKRLPYRREPVTAENPNSAIVYESYRRRMCDYNASTDESEMWNRIMAFTWKSIVERGFSRQYVYWHGDGNDGKSMYFLLFQSLLGDSAFTISSSGLQNDFSVAAFIGKRIVYVTEADPAFITTPRFKSYTGEPTLYVNPKYETPFNAFNNSIFLLTSNEAPQFDTASRADVTRLLYVRSSAKASPEIDRCVVEHALMLGAEHHLRRCRDAWERYGCKLPVSTSEELEVSTRSRGSNEQAVGFLRRFLQVDEDGFVSNDELSAAFAAARLSERDGRMRMNLLCELYGGSEARVSVVLPGATKSVRLRGFRGFRLRDGVRANLFGAS